MIVVMDHFSIDLETLGKRFDAPVIAIGVVQFDPLTGKTGAEFYREIDLDSAIRSGRVDGDTLRWWMAEAGEKARRIFANNEGKVGLATALQELTTWMRGLAGAAKAWGNGATSDITWLQHAYDRGCVGLTEPWHHTNIRDVRTAVEDAELQHDEWPPHVGTNHNALDDAKYQAAVISTCRRKIRAAFAATKSTTAVRVVKPATLADDDDI